MSEISLQEALKRQDLRFFKKSIDSSIIEKFGENLNKYADEVNEAYNADENEEYFKKLVNSFLEKNFYYEENYKINTKGYIDSAITKNGELLCIIETKTPKNLNEMLNRDNINKKALHELIYYYLEETRIVTGAKIKNKLDSQIRTLVATNSAKFFIFDSNSIENIVKGNIENYYFNFKNNNYNVTKTSDFYEYIEGYLKNNQNVLEKIDYVYFDMKDVRNDKTKKTLPALYKILSKYYLLREKYTFQVSSHTLNKKFYNELLYIMGLKETKENNVKIIKIDNSIKNSIGYQVYNKFINNEDKEPKEAEEKTFELLIIWLDRILFIKLFEGQLINFNGDEKKYHILDSEKIRDFEELDNLFFNVLGKLPKQRTENEFYNNFESVPYLNSALFERQEIEREGININELKNSILEFKPDSILKNKQYNSLPVLNYLIDFLNCYDFSSKEIEDNVKEKNRDIIDSSVLGLIFEKINGYKDGSVYTPSQITEFMSKNVVESNVLRRVNEDLGYNCANIEDLRFIIKDNHSIQLYKEINEIINSITYLDPAVGSGHFLVSLLNRIIFIKYQLGVLMYYNTDEPVRDYNIYIEDDTLIVENAQGEPFTYNQNNVLSQKMQETLFNEKKIIIEKCLFGADINEKAVYICQLRLWIELLKNAYYKEHVMQTLPNIDINIKCGDSLISRLDFEVGKEIKLEKQLDIDARKKAIKKYKNSIKRYIGENDKLEKQKIKMIINDFDALYIHPKKQTSFFEDENIEDEKNYLYYHSLEWALQYPEILSEDGIFKGFDCIIGNPPYIQLQSILKESDKLEKLNYKTYSRMGDIYCLFFELAKKLVKKDGIIAYITSNKWMRAGYGEKLRKFLTYNLNPTLLIDFGSIKVFDEATVDTCILFLTNSENQNNMISCITKENCLDKLQDYIDHNKKITSFKGDEIWIVISDIEKNIKEKIEKYGTKLSEWDISINYGVKTGFNDAFIIDEKTKNDLIKKEPKSAEIIRPILRGRDIKRYRYEFKNLWLIYIPWHFPLNAKANIQGASKEAEFLFQKQYPIIYNYLYMYKEKLSERNKSETGIRYEWYALQRWGAKYSDDFNKQKLVWTAINSEYKFCMVPEGFFINNSLFMITGNSLEMLCGILNSKLYRLYFELILSNGNYAYGSRDFFKNVPIIKSSSLNEEITSIVQSISSLIDNKILVESKKIDKIIYNIYGLSNDEINYIENKYK